jgi:uncharacterized protein
MSDAAIAFSEGPVAGFLHRPDGTTVGGLVLTHGAGGNCGSPLLIAVAEAFAALRVAVLRYDLPFRQKRRSGPPFPAQAAADREGLRLAVQALQKVTHAPAFLGGHSYGGRQASMVTAEEPGLVDGLFLMSYPLHPPSKPLDVRTSHFGALRTPALFVHGSKDPFGSAEEMQDALKMISAKTLLKVIKGAGHDLGRGKFPAAETAQSFVDFIG